MNGANQRYSTLNALKTRVESRRLDVVSKPSRLNLPDGAANANDRSQKIGNLIEGQHIRTVARRLRRVKMRLQKQSVDSDRRRRARQRRNVFALAPGRSVLSARLLNAVRRVKNDRRACPPHNDESAKIVHQRAVPEKRAPLA